MLPRCGEYGSVDHAQQSPPFTHSFVRDGKAYIPRPESHATGEPPCESREDEYREEQRHDDRTVDKLREGSTHDPYPFGRKEATDVNERQEQALQTRAARSSTESQCGVAKGESRKEHREADESGDPNSSKEGRTNVEEPQAQTHVPRVPRALRGDDDEQDNQLGEGSKACDKTADRSFIYEDETARRFFLDAANTYTEKETIVWAKSLNARIGSLSAHLIREKNRIHGQMDYVKPLRRPDIQVGQRHDRSNRVPELVEGALGTRLLAELRDIGNNGKANEDNDAAIQDALDAWSVSCAHSAIKPMLFAGRLSPRSDEEIEAVLNHMHDHEPKLARFWKKFLLQAEDSKKYPLLEEVYLEDSIRGEQFFMEVDWRAMLHEHELGLPSYKNAITETEEVLLQGLLHVFALASVEPPGISQSLRTMIEKLVKDAATLAERTRTGVFSESIETVVVQAGRTFDKESMRSADGGDAGEVKCTIQLGLNATKSKRRLLLPEVLLV